VNNRVAELAKIAGFDIPASKQVFNGNILPNSIERLVHGVVADCIDIVSSHPHTHELTEAIQKHFGIKETN